MLPRKIETMPKEAKNHSNSQTSIQTLLSLPKKIFNSGRKLLPSPSLSELVKLGTLLGSFLPSAKAEKFFVSLNNISYAFDADSTSKAALMEKLLEVYTNITSFSESSMNYTSFFNASGCNNKHLTMGIQMDSNMTQALINYTMDIVSKIDNDNDCSLNYRAIGITLACMLGCGVGIFALTCFLDHKDKKPPEDSSQLAMDSLEKIATADDAIITIDETPKTLRP